MHTANLLHHGIARRTFREIRRDRDLTGRLCLLARQTEPCSLKTSLMRQYGSGGVGFIYFKDSVPLAWSAAVLWEYSKGNTMCHIMVYVGEDARGRGLGTELTKLAVKQARKWHRHHFATPADEAGRRLFEKCGVTEIIFDAPKEEETPQATSEDRLL